MQEPIAIVGIGCRFPGANNPQTFWHLLQSGKSAIREVPPERWNSEALYDPDTEMPGKTTSRWGGFIDHVDQFDWRAFRILPREARYMDPQHRLLLEVAWEAFEDAGILFSDVAGSQTSVSIGIGWSDYLRLQSRNWSLLDGYTATGNANCFAANRLSYMFDLRGASIALDTGCSSSLNALRLACQSLWAHEADLALAGGVSLMLSPEGSIMTSKAGLLARDGLCKTLDAHADGFVSGEGAGIIVLKRISDALPSDRVYALLYDISANHNGHNKWIVATSQSAQESLLHHAYHKTGIDPAEIEYVELHGTGFLEGDAVEARALGTVLGAAPGRTQPCMIGSVKTNIGHLGTAAGIASVIKVALALYQQEIPPTLNVQQINPAIALQDLHLELPGTGKKWNMGEDPALAAVTTVSLSGANAHAILSGLPTSSTSEIVYDYHGPLILPLSAHSDIALYAYATAFKKFLNNEPDDYSSWRNICYTASVRRTHYTHRLTILAQTGKQAVSILDAFLNGQSAQGLYITSKPVPGHTGAQDQQPGHISAILPSLHQEPVDAVLEEFSILYTQGAFVNWSALYDEPYHCVSLPTFPWQREKVWLDWLNTEEISTPPESRNTSLPEKKIAEPALQADLMALPLDEALVKIWSQILEVEAVSKDSSFFDLGGHSLLAARLITQIRSTLGIELSLNTLLNASTPAACAAFIRENRLPFEGSASPLPMIQNDPEQRHLPFPTTDIQQAYWAGRNIALHGAKFGNHGYIEVNAASLDIARFNLAMQRLIERHEMLRAILLPDGQQQILPIVPLFEAKVVDLRGKDAEDALYVRQQMDHQLLPIDIWPAFDIRIVLLNKNQAQIHLSIESLFVDAWSMRLLIQEFMYFYNDIDIQLPPLKLSFRDYLLAQNSLHDTDFYKRAETYWNARLASLPLAPDVPLAQTIHKEQAIRFVHHEHSLDGQNWSRLKARAAQAKLTPSAVLLAAFAEVLSIWTKSPRFSINLSIFNRLPLHPQIHDIVGDFTSLIVLAIDTKSADTFEQRAIQIQKQLWNDLDHSAYNGVHILRELARRQGNMLQAIMPIVFSSLLIQDMEMQGPAPWQDTLYAIRQTAQVWLDHQALEAGGKLIFQWQVIEALFPDGLIETMFSVYCQLLQRLATEEESWHTTDLQLLPKQFEPRKHTHTIDEPQEGLLHMLFDRQVSQRPEQAAIITPHNTLSYREVYSSALQLAWQLRQMGARPNHLIGIIMEKGWEQIVATLSILYAGAAYLPIDPKLPDERLRYLLEHGRVTIVLTQPHIDKQIKWPDQVRRLWVDTAYLKSIEIIALEPVQTLEDLAYVIYTSGSTGLPKGVMIDHRGAVNTILDINERFRIDSSDKVFALSSLNFDLSVYDIFGTLAAGGTIIVPPNEALRDPGTWLDIVIRERVTIWNSVPTLLQMFVDYTELAPDALKQSALRLALLSGDWIPLPLPTQIQERIPGIEVISLGGATEASIWSILYPITTIDPSWKSIPYGRPMRNQSFFILNEKLESCPVWLPGQLYIAGIGLAKGYWGDEEKTRVSFIHHPQSGVRLYKTGDLGRYLPDGNIEFLGREDFQVKIRGHRIELGEIEANLLLYPGVQAAVVATTTTNAHDEKRLAAYVVLQTQSTGIPLQSPMADKKADTPASSMPHQALKMSADASRDPEQSDFQYSIPSSENGSQHLHLRFGLSSTHAFEKKEVVKLAPLTDQPDTLQRYKERTSYRLFRKKLIPFERFSNFMGTLAKVEIDGLPKFRYPSAGGIYPVETYLYIKSGRIENLAEGIYYYNPQTHLLTLISRAAHLSHHLHSIVNQNIFTESAFSLFFIGHLQAISAVYANAARDFCLLEAGYMSQLLMMEAAKHAIGLCPIGDMAFEAIRPLFALEENHVFLHSLLGGYVDAIEANGWSFAQDNLRLLLEETQNTSSLENPAAKIRLFLQKKLPDYMVPHSITIVDALPLTSNGKVDRKNLPVPEMTIRENRTTKTPVRQQAHLVQTITDVWKELLPPADISIDDNFFDLGGNSLVMIRAYTSLQKQLPIKISIDTFFQHFTIRSLAEALHSALENNQETK